MTQSRQSAAAAPFAQPIPPLPAAETDGIRARLQKRRPVVLDGALGTELQRHGIRCELPLWSANALIESPDTVRRIHEAYVDAGSEILTANTFRTQARTLARTGEADRSRQLTDLAVSLAREAAANASQRTWIAGSAPPLEDCYEPERVPDESTLEREHAEHAENLARAGVDLVLVETMIATREARAAAAAARRTDLPFGVSFACSSNARLLSGEPLEAAVDAIATHEPSFVAVNCLPPQDVPACLLELDRLRDRLPPETVLGAYANLGLPGPDGYRDACTPERFAEHVLAWIAQGARVVGGCCGTTPETLRAIAHALGEPVAASDS